VISWRLAPGLGLRLPAVLPRPLLHHPTHAQLPSTSSSPSVSITQKNLARHVSPLRFEGAYISRFRHRGSNAQTDLRNLDHHLLPRGPPLPGRIRSRGHLARGYSSGGAGKGWNRARGGAEGDEQAVGAGHERREAVHSERVSAFLLLLHHGFVYLTGCEKQHDLRGCRNDG
jgi:hypothetical protein